MRKTSVLFTCGDMKIGGVQKSLISLFETIDNERFDVTLMVPTLHGELHDQIPSYIKIVKAPAFVIQPSFEKKNIKSDFKYILRNPHYIIPFIKSSYYAVLRGSKYSRQVFWDNTEKRKENNHFKFDVAISYAGGMGVWNSYIIDCIDAPIKICWIHGDFSVFKTGLNSEKNYLLKFDKIVAVSNKVKQVLINEVPCLREKVVVIENIINKDKLIQMAKDEVVCTKIDDRILFVSISRLDKGKGFDLAIKAFYKATKCGVKISWNIIGDGPELDSIKALISNFNLENEVKLLGKKLNPYPYLNEADVFLHPSRGEGKSIAVDEAMVFGKPILITNYPTVRDQIENNVTGEIVPITEEGIFNGIIKMSQNSELRQKYIANLKNYNKKDESISKIYELLKNNET